MRHEGKLITSGSADALWVELYDSGSHQVAERVQVSRDEFFTVYAQSTHLYKVRVVTNHGVRIVSEHLQFRPGQPVEIRLPKSMTDGPRRRGRSARYA